MAKGTQRTSIAIKPTKKARVEKEGGSRPIRAKGSPRPKFKSLGNQNKGKEKAEIQEKPAQKPRPSPPQSSLKLKSESSKTQAEIWLPSTFKVIAGSYEKLLYGLEGTVTLINTIDDPSSPSTSSSSPYTFHLKPVFIFPAHVSCIKAVAASPQGGKWLATGSADEIIKVWDLRRRKEIGGLMHHEGSITHLNFPSRSHLLSASEDGTLCIFHARDWKVLRALKGHKGRVNSVAVHPSGKVALSVGKDKTLRMWDLMHGKGRASIKLGKEGEIVRWSTDGSLFAVQAGSTIDLYNTDMTPIHTITHPSRLHDFRFSKRVIGTGEVLLAAAEDKKLSIYDIPDNPDNIPTLVAVMIGHTNRVKAVQTLDIALPASPSGQISTTIICTVSSDGRIHIYDMAALPAANMVATEQGVSEIDPKVVYDSKGTRLTCVTLADGEVEGSMMPANGKRKRDDGDDESEHPNEESGSDDDEGWADEEREEEEGIESESK